MITAVFMTVCVCVSVGMLPEQRSAAILGGPSYNQFLLPMHVLPGQTMAAASQCPRHVQWLKILLQLIFHVLTQHKCFMCAHSPTTWACMCSYLS